MRRQQESCCFDVKQKYYRAKQEVWVVMEIPDETEALDTEMVGASESVL